MTRSDTIFQVSVSGTGGTAVGVVWTAVSAKGLAAVEIGGCKEDFISELVAGGGEIAGVYSQEAVAAADQIKEYLAGKRQQFDLAVDWSALSPFQAAALKVVSAIPYGHTMSYGQVAEKMGRPGAARAVGRANATNPMPLVIPCHRVVAADGQLRGYGAGEGLKTKAWLLALEKGSLGS